MTRRMVLDAVNRHLAKSNRGPLTMRQYSRAVRIARAHRLISEENLEWARRGYRPDPEPQVSHG